MADGRDGFGMLLDGTYGMAALSEAEIEEKFDLGYHFKHVDTVFDRVFGAADKAR